MDLQDFCINVELNGFTKNRRSYLETLSLKFSVKFQYNISFPARHTGYNPSFIQTVSMEKNIKVNHIDTPPPPSEEIPDKEGLFILLSVTGKLLKCQRS